MPPDRGRSVNWFTGGKLGSLLGLLSLLSLALVACGGQAGAHGASSATSKSSPTSTTSTSGLGATPAPPGQAPLPYSLPATWQNAPGLSQAEAAGPVAYAFAPSNGAYGYVCGSSSGVVYTTSDGGQSWNARNAAPFTGCEGISIDAQDAFDVFIQSPTAAQTNGIPDGVDLWRSRDGGATWHKLGAVTGTGFRLSWAHLGVVGSQLIGQVTIDEEGSLPDYLYASSDGGYTWSPFGQSIANQGYTVNSFTTLGSAIYISSMKNTGGASGMAAPIRPSMNSAHAAMRPLDAPLSGQPPNPPVFWRSLDGGATWSQATLPGATLYATPRADGHGSYALSVTTTDVSSQPQSPLYDAAIWWSADSGATWSRLPDMQGLENGYVLGGGASTIALGADGTVFATAQHAADGGPDDAGIFYIQPGKSTPAWQPLAAGGVQNWQANVAAFGLRLWAVGENQGDTRLKYVDVA